MIVHEYMHYISESEYTYTFFKGFVQIHTLNLNGIRLGVAGAMSLVEMLANQTGVITEFCPKNGKVKATTMVMCRPQKSAKYRTPKNPLYI